MEQLSALYVDYEGCIRSDSFAWLRLEVVGVSYYEDLLFIIE